MTWLIWITKCFDLHRHEEPEAAREANQSGRRASKWDTTSCLWSQNRSFLWFEKNSPRLTSAFQTVHVYVFSLRGAGVLPPGVSVEQRGEIRCGTSGCCGVRTRLWLKSGFWGAPVAVPRFLSCQHTSGCCKGVAITRRRWRRRPFGG